MHLHSDGGFHATWSPDIPKRLTKDDLNGYMQVRNALVAEMATKLGTVDRLSGVYRFALWSPDNLDWRSHIIGGRW